MLIVVENSFDEFNFAITILNINDKSTVTGEYEQVFIDRCVNTL